MNFLNTITLDPKNIDYSQEELDNHANQLNPNNDAYWQSRSENERPDVLGRPNLRR